MDRDGLRFANGRVLLNTKMRDTLSDVSSKPKTCDNQIRHSSLSTLVHRTNPSQYTKCLQVAARVQFPARVAIAFVNAMQKVKQLKAIPLQVWKGPEGSRRLRLPNLMTIGTRRYGCQPYAPVAFTTCRKYSWYSFLLETESTPGPQCDRKDYVNEKFQ